MVTPGLRSRDRVSVEEVARRMMATLRKFVPAAVPGVAFLSGGQSDEEATAHLSAMNQIPDLALVADLLLWPRAADCNAGGLERRRQQRGHRPGRLHPPRQDECACCARPVSAGTGSCRLRRPNRSTSRRLGRVLAGRALSFRGLPLRRSVSQSTQWPLPVTAMSAQLFLIVPPNAAPAKTRPRSSGSPQPLKFPPCCCGAARWPRTPYKTMVEAIAPGAQALGAAVMIEGEPGLVRLLGADGLHVQAASGSGARCRRGAEAPSDCRGRRYRLAP